MNFPAVTPEAGISAVILFFIGYILGVGIKSSIKYVGIFLLFLAFLVVVGILPNQTLQRIVDVIQTLKPVAEEAGGMLGLKQAVSLGTIGFVSGFVIGLIRG